MDFDILTRGRLKKALHGEAALTWMNQVQVEEMKDKVQDLSQTQGTSSPSQQSSANSLKTKLRKELSQFTWVQCDNPNCMKWRRVPNSDAENLEAESKWFCSMNPDGAFNKCEIAEEDYREYERMAQKCGMKFVSSALPLGELVWAKVAGYCQWPGVLSKDPVLDDYVTLSSLGDPEWYHVEFLGGGHSHVWVRSGGIAPFGHVDPEELTQTQRSKTSFKKLPRPLTKTRRDVPCRRRYKGSNVEAAIKQANQLLSCTAEERLELCIYKKASSIPSAKGTPKMDVYQFTNSPKIEMKTGKSKRKEPMRKKREPCQTVPTKQDSPSLKVPKEKRKKFSAPKQIDQCEGLSSPIGSHASTISSTGSFVVPNIGSAIGSLTNFNIGSMATMSKEEKFTLDIENYRKNEKAFNHDLHRFLSRNDRRLSKLPFWQNTPVSLFTLFENVVDRGGFHRVTKLGKWNPVYREVVGTNNAGSGGSSARKYYERNLLAYEMYLRGKDFSSYLPKKLGRKPLPLDQRKSSTVSKVSSKAEFSEDEDLEFDNCMSDLEEMLKTLDDVGDDATATASGIQPPSSPPKPLLPLCFGDDTPPTHRSVIVADVASEFGFANEPDEPAQTVPIMDFILEASGTAGSSDELLHEMQALEQVFDEMDNQNLLI